MRSPCKRDNVGSNLAITSTEYDNMTLKEQEKKLMKKVNDNNLVRIVRHFRIKEEFGECLAVVLEDDVYKNTKAITIVALLEEDHSDTSRTHIYDISDDADINMFIRDMKNGSFDDVKGFGYAICSGQDNFNKTLGRLIATGRALKQLE